MTDQTVVNLLGLYAGLLLLNTLISAFMWWIGRLSLYRDVVAVWAAMLGAFVAQGITGDLFRDWPFGIVLGFSTLFVANLAHASLITHLVGDRIPWRSSLVLFAAALPLSFAISLSTSWFPPIAMPVAIAVVWPAMFAATRTLWTRWSTLTPTARALMFSGIAVGLHELDYPFFRHLDEYAAMGFTVGILVVFALSIFAPAVVLEYATTQQARAVAEMEVAHRIQTRVLPREPSIPGLELACHMKPAESVGGDYYDVYNLGDHSWILLGDVTGHGLSSGLVMLMAQSILASILHAREGISPSELNFLANRVLHQNLSRLEELRSMSVVALCRAGGAQRFVYSGNHDHVWVWRKSSGSVERVRVTQTPHDLGFLDEFPRSEYAESTFDLHPGDLLFLASDGIVEAARQGRYADGLFDPERLVKLLDEVHDQPLAAIKERLLRELEQFTGGVFHDDVTFLLARPVAA